MYEEIIFQAFINLAFFSQVLHVIVHFYNFRSYKLPLVLIN